MKHIKETAVFTLDQLSQKAQDKAFELWSASEYEGICSDMLLGDVQELLQMIGFYNVSICYTLSYSQGDGAGFDAKYKYKKGALKALTDYAPNSPFVDIAKQLQALQRKNFYKVWLETLTPHGNYTNVRHIEYVDDESMRVVGESDFLNVIRDIDKIIYDIVSSNLEYYTSEPCFQEWIESEDIVFNESGSKWFFASECML